jgi:feruloyl esterase
MKHKLFDIRLAVPVFFIACLGLNATPAVASSCTNLETVSLPNTTITAAQDIPAGTFAGQANLPAFCRVTATLTPTFDSNILIELWMPAAGWNGRFEGIGGGGYQGGITYGNMGPPLRQGYAVANTDEGTSSSGCTALYCGQSGNQGNPIAIAFGESAAATTGLLGHPERIKDFGWRAMHLMSVRSKELVKAYYQRPADHSYFSGCSTGGQNALMEAQRFPDDYDGILAGSPAHYRTHNHLVVNVDWVRATAKPDSQVSSAQMTLVNNAVLAACAGQDGGLKSDLFLTDPRDCHFDPKVLECTGSNAPPSCLTADQLATMQQYYLGVSNPRTGELIYPGYSLGSEAPSFGALGLILNEALPEPAFDGFFYWAFGSQFGNLSSAHNYKNFDFDHDVDTVDNALAADLNATNTDLSEFNKHGRKMILFHGFADPLIPPQGSINYYNAVVARGGEGDDDGGGGLKHTQKFFRLFLAPGTWHCGSGPGANVFGGAFNQGPTDADHSAISALARWVETGVAPEEIIATKYVNDNPASGIAFQRPLCPFPKVAKYNGSGNSADASSFTCVTDEKDHNQKPAPRYAP